MATTFNELLGEHLLQHNESGDGTTQISTSELNGKPLALYFSAHWCPPCRRFTPKLAETYKTTSSEVKEKLNIVFVSCDEDENEFNEYFKDMPWKALPYSDRKCSQQLGEKFGVEGIPCLVILSGNGEKLTSEGVEEFNASSNQAIKQWSEGKHLFWSREPHEGEYVWNGISCTKCYMSPLLGKRRGCPNRECDLDLCETCSSDVTHEHSIIEYLIPKKRYPLEEIFKSVPHLLNSENKENIETKTLWADHVQAVGIYFSAHWCPPCRAFTPELAKIYTEAQADCPDFRLVFVSCDRDEASFDEYRAEMPWPAVPLNSGVLLKSYFQFSGIPTLIVIKPDGSILTRSGRNAVSGKKTEAIKLWSKGERVPPPKKEEFVWESVTCDGCTMAPLVGERFYCATCGNYDLCSSCANKGHEHELKVIPQPSEDDDD